MDDLIEYQLEINNEVVGFYTYKIIHESNQEDFLYFYLQNKFTFHESSIEILKNKSNLILLDRIEVFEEHREKGFGNQLIEHFFNEVEDSTIILVADGEGPSFLIEWYESLGFNAIDTSEEGHYLMIS